MVTKIESGSFGNLTITALWNPHKYRITYDLKYKREAKNPNVYYSYNTDSEITLKDASFDEYHVFKGWYLDPEFENKIEVIQGSLMEDITLYAKWDFKGTYISSRSDFKKIAYNPSGAYELTEDIVISAGVCDSSNPFKGYFYGQDNTLYGAQPFGVIDKTATVRNVKVSKYALADTNKGYVYLCVGNNGLVTTNSGTIESSASNGGFVYTTLYDNGAYEYVAGLVATNTGTIIGCYSSTTINVEANSGGGLVGINKGTISDSYFRGTLRIQRAYPVAAGIAANGSTGSIINCYSTGAVWGIAKPTGTGPYANSSFGISAGIVGDQSSSTIIKNSFSCAEASAGISVAKYGTLSVYKCYYASDLCDYARAIYDYNGIKNKYSGAGYGIGTNSSNFKSASFVKNTLGWTSEYWSLSDGRLPKLKCENIL